MTMDVSGFALFWFLHQTYNCEPLCKVLFARLILNAKNRSYFVVWRRGLLQNLILSCPNKYRYFEPFVHLDHKCHFENTDL